MELSYPIREAFDVIERSSRYSAKYEHRSIAVANAKEIALGVNNGNLCRHCTVGNKHLVGRLGCLACVLSCHLHKPA